MLHHLTLDELRIIYDGWLDNYKIEMEKTRMICYHVFNASMNRTTSPSIYEFMPFEWDKKDEKETQIRHSTKEEFEVLKNIVDNLKTNK